MSKGRDPIPINWDLVDNLCSINCTAEEIAAVIGVNNDTLTNRCKAEKNLTFSEYRSTKVLVGNMSLRRAQYRSALGYKETVQKTMKRKVKRQVVDKKGEIKTDKKGKPVWEESEEFIPVETEEYFPPTPLMQIWLGKQVLGQKDEVIVNPGQGAISNERPMINITVESPTPKTLEGIVAEWVDQDPTPRLPAPETIDDEPLL